jgi:hypothetical protein
MKGVQNTFVKSREKQESIILVDGVAASDRQIVEYRKKVVPPAPSPTLSHPVTKHQP